MAFQAFLRGKGMPIQLYHIDFDKGEVTDQLAPEPANRAERRRAAAKGKKKAA